MKSVTRKIAVVNGEITIIKQVESVSYINEKTNRFISVEQIQEVGREADCVWPAASVPGLVAVCERVGSVQYNDGIAHQCVDPGGRVLWIDEY